jgi:heme/copper-type cytochrome/quinol oxidase subunit 1
MNSRTTRRIYSTTFLGKARVLYITNNWVYTTNHKRIAVNYFFFVKFAGIVGSVLATIIRSEMAYPGVGILAGDSLQYLSVVTAHAVVMVFFMIMPLMFGAFANFLLPTQLGVHDVAFPRLNSAAFWFLPGGLLMLCQLVCLDRRYQRMNCFNVREIQSILKGRFYPKSMNTFDHRDFFDSIILGVRFKANGSDAMTPDMALFYNYGLYIGSIIRNQSYACLDWFETRINSIIIYSRNSILRLLLSLLRSITKSPLYTGFEKKVISLITYSHNSMDSILSTFQECDYSYLSKYSGTITDILHIILVDLSKTIFYYVDLITELVCNTPKYVNNSQNARISAEIKSLYASTFTGTTSTSLIRKDLYNSFSEVTNMFGNALLYTKLFTLEVVKTLLIIRIQFFDKNQYSIWNLSGSLGSTKNLAVHTEFNYILFVVISTYNHIIRNLSKSNVLNLLNDFINYVTYLYNFKFYFVGWDDLNFYLINKFINNIYLTSVTNSIIYTTINNFDVEFSSTVKTNSILNLDDKVLTSSQELVSNFRQQRSTNPLFRYNFKTGNYLNNITKELSPSMFTSLSSVTMGIRQSSWFFSGNFSELFSLNFDNYTSTYVETTPSTPVFHKSSIDNTNSFYNFFYSLSDSGSFINTRWISINTIDQKFYRMFTTSSMQQRVYANWRQLKFTREAWRCKLLSARHQKTLYKRYVSEDKVFWSVERNAKDVLPGWAMITPFSARPRFTAIGKVDIGLMGVFLVLNSSIVSSANFLVTYRYLSTLNNRKMRDARSFFTEGVMVASWMMIAANPMLAIGILMLLSDRHWQTSFFDYSGGGDTVLFQHMFWFFGHPEVYVIMIPAFGFNNTILSFYLRKRVSARASLMYSMYTIAFLGFFVWGHHMYMVGLAHTTRMLFSTLTVMISIPAATKLMHWCVTLVNSSFWVELPFLFTLLFIFFFVSGGISGMAVAHTGMDVLFHDSFYVIGHFHVMFAGAAMFASFGAFYFYFPSIFGVKFSRIWGYLHIVYFLLGQLMTVIPMFWLGYSGMPRRILDYPASLGGWHAIVSAGHMLSIAGLMAFFIMIFDSLRQGRAATRNSFGISRFNTRFNFYLYEVARSRFVQRKGWYIARYSRPNMLLLGKLNYNNNELLETTLYSYILVNETNIYFIKSPKVTFSQDK